MSKVNKSKVTLLIRNTCFKSDILITRKLGKIPRNMSVIYVTKCSISAECVFLVYAGQTGLCVLVLVLYCDQLLGDDQEREKL